MLKPSALIVALFAMFSTSVLAQDLRVCPNVQVGEWDSGAASDLQRLHHAASWWRCRSSCIYGF